MCWFKKKRTIKGILTQDVFNHVISYGNDKVIIYLNGEGIPFDTYQIARMKNDFKIGFAILLTIEMKKEKITNIIFRNIFKISDSIENDGITGISFFYRKGKDVYRRTVTKSSSELKGFQSAAVTKPWFYINKFDNFIIINDNISLFYDVGYFSDIDYSLPDINITESTQNIDHSFKIDDEEGLSGLGF